MGMVAIAVGCSLDQVGAGGQVILAAGVAALASVVIAVQVGAVGGEQVEVWIASHGRGEVDALKAFVSDAEAERLRGRVLPECGAAVLAGPSAAESQTCTGFQAAQVHRAAVSGSRYRESEVGRAAVSAHGRRRFDQVVSGRQVTLDA